MNSRLKLVIQTLVSRFKEPSTYAGFGGLALAFGVSAPAWAAWSGAAATVFGIIAAIVPEASGK